MQARLRSARQGALGLVQSGDLPAVGQGGGVGGDGGVIGKCNDILLTAVLHGQRAGAVLDHVNVLRQLCQCYLIDPL